MGLDLAEVNVEKATLVAAEEKCNHGITARLKAVDDIQMGTGPQGGGDEGRRPVAKEKEEKCRRGQEGRRRCYSRRRRQRRRGHPGLLYNGSVIKATAMEDGDDEGGGREMGGGSEDLETAVKGGGEGRGGGWQPWVSWGGIRWCRRQQRRGQERGEVGVGVGEEGPLEAVDGVEHLEDGGGGGGRKGGGRGRR